MRDWVRWHEAYSRSDSGLADRLAAVREAIHGCLDQGAESVRVVSACAGDGRDLLGVLAERRDAGRVTGLLVEKDPRLAGRARDAALATPAGLTVAEGDAGRSAAYLGYAPADLVLMCGVFGNISDADIERTVHALPQLCAPGGHVIWTRHRKAPDVTPAIREWFEEVGFDEIEFVAPEDDLWSVGTHRYMGAAVDREPDQRWFTFIR